MSIELTDEQAKQLKDCVIHCGQVHVYGDGVHRSTHKPLLEALTPKLAEPTNFGAIVKDENGVYWAKIDFQGNLCWCRINQRPWDDIFNPTLIQSWVKE